MLVKIIKKSCKSFHDFNIGDIVNIKINEDNKINYYITPITWIYKSECVYISQHINFYSYNNTYTSAIVSSLSNEPDAIVAYHDGFFTIISIENVYINNIRQSITDEQIQEIVKNNNHNLIKAIINEIPNEYEIISKGLVQSNDVIRHFTNNGSCNQICNRLLNIKIENLNEYLNIKDDMIIVYRRKKTKEINKPKFNINDYVYIFSLELSGKVISQSYNIITKEYIYSVLCNLNVHLLKEKQLLKIELHI